MFHESISDPTLVGEVGMSLVLPTCLHGPCSVPSAHTSFPPQVSLPLALCMACCPQVLRGMTCSLDAPSVGTAWVAGLGTRGGGMFCRGSSPRWVCGCLSDLSSTRPVCLRPRSLYAEQSRLGHLAQCPFSPVADASFESDRCRLDSGKVLAHLHIQVGLLVL